MPKQKRIHYGHSRSNEGLVAYQNAPKKRFVKQRRVRNRMAKQSRKINRGR